MKFLLILMLLFSFEAKVFAQEFSTDIPLDEFQSITDLFTSSLTFQIAFTILIIGIMLIVLAHRYFSKWIDSKKISYTVPQIARFLKIMLLPFFVTILIISINSYVQTTDFFTENMNPLNEEISISEIFTKILNSLSILIIGYTTSHIITIILNKREKLKQEKEFFEAWKELRGFPDDVEDFFHTICEWLPPKTPPDNMTKKEFENLLRTEEGRHHLQQYRTSKGNTIGIFKQKVSHPFKEWQKSERLKYEKYYDDCISGNNETNRPLKPGVIPKEIFSIDEWREEKQLINFDLVVAGARPPGYIEKRTQELPKSLNQITQVTVFFITILIVMSWWNIDIFVLGTMMAGFGVGIGFALKETMENFFSYFMIRKDKIFTEGDRVEIDQYNGYIHKITSRVTYVRHALNESIAIFPTRQLIASKVINYSKEMKFVPAIVEVGVSYLNNSKQVAAILTKVGQRTMREVTDDRNKHLVIQNQCPYIDENKPSCGCDKDLMIDLKQPKVRFIKFNESSLDFKIWVYVREYEIQFKVESAMRMMIQEEFKKYDIRIPWPIRTVYSGDDKKEAKEIAELEEEREKAFDEYGIGDIKLK